MKNYPKWIYHCHLPAVVVNNPEEHEAMGEEWSEVPVAPTDELVIDQPANTPAPAIATAAPRRKRRD